MNVVTIPALIIDTILIGQDVASVSIKFWRFNFSYISSIFNLQPQLFLKHRKVTWEVISVGVKLPAYSLKQEVGPVTQQGVPIMTQVEFLVPPPSVYFINADELSVPRISERNTVKKQWFSFKKESLQPI